MRYHVLICTLALGFGAGSCGPPRPDGPNVVLIVLDTARPDWSSAYGHPRPTTPYLEKFAAEGTKFERAYSVSCWTLPAHASMFTGVGPEEHGATGTTQRLVAQLPLLAERFSLAGYKTGGFSNNPWISDRSGLNGGFEHFEDLWNKDVRATYPKGRHATLQATEQWLAERGEADEPFFLFVNLIEPHLPYRPPWKSAARHFMTRPEFERGMRTLFQRGGAANELVCRHYAGKEPFDKREWGLLSKFYESELRDCDRVVAGIMAQVDAISPPGETIVLIVSDHGENLGDHDHLSHMFNLYDSNLRVIFIARGPGFEAGKVDRRLVQLQDTYPTLLAAAGLSVGAHNDGEDLRAAPPARRRLTAMLEVPALTFDTFPDEVVESGALDLYDSELRAVIDGRYKLVRSSKGEEWCFDLEQDPLERTPIDPTTVYAADELAELRALAEPLGGRSARDGIPEEWADSTQMEAFRDLGYAGDGK